VIENHMVAARRRRRSSRTSLCSDTGRAGASELLTIHMHEALCSQEKRAHRLLAVVFCVDRPPSQLPNGLRARAEAAPTWNEHGLRRSVAGSVTGLGAHPKPA
jgi:hypothetical protein